MKALTYHGSKDVRIETVPDPAVTDDDDILLRVTATAICGSDLHIYRGKIPSMKDGDILGHEFMGIVEDTGRGVSKLKKGDRVVVPFTISCGNCFFCTRSLFAACENTNSGRGAIINKKDTRPGAGLFGYSHLYGGYAGGQAQYVRVPKANVGPLLIPDSSLSDDQVLFLSDILPTGYQAVANGGVGQGSTVAIFGAGPVGLMAAACARMLGAERIFMVDHHPYRLQFAAEAYGIEPINFDEVDDPAAVIIERTAHHGVDASMAATRRGGTVSVPGVYAGWIHGFLFGDAFEKGLTFKGGQTHAQRFMPELLQAISEGKLQPQAIITHQLTLDDAPRGYELFNEKREDCRKVVLIP